MPSGTVAVHGSSGFCIAIVFAKIGPPSLPCLASFTVSTPGALSLKHGRLRSHKP